MIFLTNDKDEVDVKELYEKQCILEKDEFLKSYNININGLSKENVIKNQKQYGKNQIKQGKEKKW